MTIDEEYYDIVKSILESEEFQKRKKYKHHGNISVYSHCLSVSKKSYKIAKKMNLDYKSAAIGGLLHDFYKEPWQENIEKKKLLEQHGFTHAKEAAINAKEFYPDLVDKKVYDIILRHMFPLNKVPPKYKEGWIVTLVDKGVSMEVFKNPKDLPKLIGIKRRIKK